MRCYNCGKEIDDKAVICVGCGVAVKPIKPQEKKLSGLQIAAYILFGLQAFALIGLGFQYGAGVVGTVIGYLAFTIVGVICLVVDNNKKTKGVVNEAKEAKQEQGEEEIIEEKVMPASYYKNVAAFCGILSAMAFISFVILLVIFLLESGESDIYEVIMGVLGFIILISFIVFLVSLREYKKRKEETSDAKINLT